METNPNAFATPGDGGMQDGLYLKTRLADTGGKGFGPFVARYGPDSNGAAAKENTKMRKAFNNLFLPVGEHPSESGQLGASPQFTIGQTQVLNAQRGGERGDGEEGSGGVGRRERKRGMGR